MNAAVAAIAAVGGVVELQATPMGLLQAQIPYDQLDALAADAAIKHVRLPAYALTRTGSVTSQGDAVHKCNTVRSSLGINGSGRKVGVISDGINGINASLASGDIPAGYQAQSARSDFNLNAGPEGLAMMEIIYDLAPGASLAFSNPNTSAEMLTAINILDSTYHCNVICDDLGFADEPYFEDGPIVTRINQAVANGAIYCSAAGNAGNQNYYEGDFAATTKTIGGQSLTVHNFNGGDTNMQAYIPPGETLYVILQWNDPWGASSNDYDLYLTNSSGTTILASSTDAQNGNDEPLEVAVYRNNSGTGLNVYVVVAKDSGAARHLKLESWYGWFTEYSTATGSISGHAAGQNVICCAAVPAASPSNIESFSSRGPVRIDFPSLTFRYKPDVSGTDGVSVTANGGFVSPFYGTSAATPHIAAICAQIWSFDPSMTNTTVRNILQNTAVDLGAAGYDTIYGYGRADALAAMAGLNSCPASISAASSPALGGSVGGTGVYNCGTTATLTATPNAGYAFTNWTENGALVSTSSNYSFTVAGNRSLVANFTPISVNYTITTVSSPLAGGTTTGGGSYASGVTVSVTATPNSGFTFVNWTESGVQVSASSAYSFAATANRTIVANFSQIPTVETPAIAPAGGSFTDSVDVTITTATVGATVTYTTNNSDPTASSTPYTGVITVTGNTTLKARAFLAGYHDSAVTSATFFVNPAYAVSTSADPIEGGTTTGDGSYPSGTRVIVRATPNNGYQFVNWTRGGSVVSTFANYQFTITDARTLVAHFSVIPPTFNVTATAAPPEAGTISGAGPYPINSTVTLIANTNTGYRFLNWTENGTQVGASPSYQFTITADRALVANFGPASLTPAPTISPNGGTFTTAPLVSISDSLPGAFITYTTDGSEPAIGSIAYNAPFTLGSSATVKAKAFATGLTASTTTSASFTVSNSQKAVVYTLTIESGSDTPVLQQYAAGATAIVSAPPAPDGQQFSYWGGDITSSDNPVSVQMNADKIIIANYQSCPIQSAPCGAGTPVCGLAAIPMLALMRPRRRQRSGR